MGDGIYQIRGTLVVSYLLVDTDGVTLIDTGFINHFERIEQALHEVKREWSDVQAILLTHGHLDHTLNLSHIRQKTSAPIYAHPLEEQHIDGTYPYQGAGRLCGLLECIGRSILKYQPVSANNTLTDYQDLDLFGGLKVIRLPGHTAGHCGFYSKKTDIFFTGDLFAARRLWGGLPWFWLNTQQKDFSYSINKVLEMNPQGMLSNHCNLGCENTQKLIFLDKCNG